MLITLHKCSAKVHNDCWRKLLKQHPTRVPIDQKESVRWLNNLRQSKELIGAPERCVHIVDRESDIFELYSLAQELGTNFLVRICVDRLAENGEITVAKAMVDVSPSGEHQVRFRDASGKQHETTLSVKFTSMIVRSPVGKHKDYHSQRLQIIHAEELNPPEDRPALFWKLITNLEVATHEDAVHKLGWYARRWSIETFFKALKSGCRIESIRLTTADCLANCIVFCCIVAWRIHWMVMLQREHPDADPRAVFTHTECVVLDRASSLDQRDTARNLRSYMIAVAKLGGYLLAVRTRHRELPFYGAASPASSTSS